MSEQEAALTFKPVYVVRAYGGKVRFIWSSTPRKPLRGSTDLRVGVSFSELLRVAKIMRCQVNGSEIYPLNQDAYNRLLIYACVRPTIKEPNKVLRLAECVAEMGGWDAHYWASAFREIWWLNGNYRSLRKVVRAFKFFFNI